MMTLKQQLQFIFKRHFLLGSFILGFGFTFVCPFSYSLWICLAMSLLGGFVLASCFKLIVQNMALSSVQFYEHAIKFRVESGRFRYWRVLLIRRFCLTVFCMCLILALISLPIWIQYSAHSVSYLYLGLVIICYGGMWRYLKIHLSSWRVIKERSQQLEEMLDQATTIES